MQKQMLNVFILLISLIDFGCSDSQNNKAVAARVYGIKAGSAAPDFTLRDMNEQSVSLSEYKGRVVLLTFWKVKCNDCLKTLPSIETLGKQLNNPQLAILAVNVDNLEYVKPEKIHAFLNENRLSFRVAADETFSASEAYKLLAVPMTYLIDKAGIIRDIKFGEQDWTNRENIERIQALLN